MCSKKLGSGARTEEKEKSLFVGSRTHVTVNVKQLVVSWYLVVHAVVVGSGYWVLQLMVNKY